MIIKGIDKSIIDDRISEIRKNYPEEEIVPVLAKNRLNKLKGCDPQKARKRVYAYLLRRGFSPEVVIDILKQGRL